MLIRHGIVVSGFIYILYHFLCLVQVPGCLISKNFSKTWNENSLSRSLYVTSPQYSSQT
jgi:hypothetical protein